MTEPHTSPFLNHPSRGPNGGLLISEIFGPTIQGEGPAAGQRAVFVRTGGCPVSCTWCDTKFAWDPKHKEDVRAPKLRPVREVAARVIELAGGARTIIVITGGEPLAQAEHIHQLVLMLREANFPVHLETAGVHRVPSALLRMFDLVVVSPKLSSAGEVALKMRSPQILRQLASMDNVWFKFVVTSAEEMDEAAVIVGQAPAERIMVMAEGTDAANSLRLTKDIADEAINRGWSISPRLHIWLWNDAPGR